MDGDGRWSRGSEGHELDLSLNELEQQELELERRRIIVNQVVRRKKIDTWVSSRRCTSTTSTTEQVLMEITYDDTAAPSRAPPLPPRNPGWSRSKGAACAVSPWKRTPDSPPTSPTPPMSHLDSPDLRCKRSPNVDDDAKEDHADTTKSALNSRCEPLRNTTMADHDDQQLIGFDDSPVVLPDSKKVEPNLVHVTKADQIQVSKAELILNTLNAEKSLLLNGNAEAPVNGHHTNPEGTPPTNGTTDTNAHKGDGEDTINGTKENGHHHHHVKDGEPVYSEVPEDNIYEEVMPVQDRLESSAFVITAKEDVSPKGTETTPLYDDSSLSSELSTELSPPPSNGNAMSDPECDTAMAMVSAPESHLQKLVDIPLLVVEESSPVDSDGSNDESAHVISGAVDGDTENAARNVTEHVAGDMAVVAIENTNEGTAEKETVTEDVTKNVTGNVIVSAAENVTGNVVEDVNDHATDVALKKDVESVPRKVTEGIPKSVTEDIPKSATEDVPKNVTEDFTKTVTENVTVDLPVEEPLVLQTVLPVVKHDPDVEIQSTISPTPESVSVSEVSEVRDVQHEACEKVESSSVAVSDVRIVDVELAQPVVSPVGRQTPVDNFNHEFLDSRPIDAWLDTYNMVDVPAVSLPSEFKQDAVEDVSSSRSLHQEPSEPLYATPSTARSFSSVANRSTTEEEVPVVSLPLHHESRLLKQSVEDSIVAREIRAQKEREETIARERKIAQEAAKLSPVVDKTHSRSPTMPDRPSIERSHVSSVSTVKLTRPTLSQTSSPPALSSPSGASPAPFPAPIEKRFNCASDSKIAGEIRELQEREEELRELRERLHFHEEPPKPSSEDGGLTNGASSCSPSSSSSSSGAVSRTVSVESLPCNGQYSSGYMFGSRRKDKITVRPLSDGGEDISPSPAFASDGESPIEREIRLARDREDALRREKGLLGHLRAEGFIRKGEAASLQSLSSNKSTVPTGPSSRADSLPSLGGSTQRILATSRIQQEIEEQTRREMALRDSGHIQTISQERTDSRVTRIGGDSESTGSTTPTASAATARRPPFDKVLPNVEIYEKTPSPSVKTPPTTHNAGQVKPTNGHIVSNCTSNGVAKSANNGTARGVSMQRFLASRGKELAFTGPAQNGGFADKTSGFEYRELKPPQLQKGALPGDAPRKGLVTAEMKIQEEMRANKEREEELRRQRMRLLGQSQPNLSLLDCGTHSESTVDGCQLQRVGSNPNLIESPQPPSPEGNGHGSGVPRRRSALIAQWEQRIHSTDFAKS